MSPYQFLVPAFALIMILIGISRYRRGGQTTREFIGWTVIWLIFAAIALYPDPVVKGLEAVTGIKSGINALIFFFIVVISYVVLRILVRLEHIEQDITKLVRSEAIKDFKNNNKNNS